MQKIIALLEKHVQWGVLALGALFLFYTVWTYLYNNPAAQQMPPYGTQTPGSVDKTIADNSATQLEQKTKQTHDEFHIAVHLDAKINVNAPTTQPIDPQAAVPMWDAWYIDPAKLIGNIGPGNVPQIQTLPTLPALAYVDNEPLRTVIVPSAASGAPAPAAGAVAAHQDLDSVTTFWSLPSADLAKAYKNAFGAKLRPALQVATFVRATLIRQERLSSGDWGPETAVPAPFNLVPPPAYPGAPDQAQFQADAAAYKAWAQAQGNQAAIAAAPYPTVAIANAPELQWLPLEAWIPYRAKLQAEAAQPVIDVPPPAAAPAPVPNPAIQNQLPGGIPGAPGGGGGGFRGRGGGPEGGPPVIIPPPAPEQPQPAAPGEPVFVVPPIPKLLPVPDNGFNPAAVAAQGEDMELFFHDLTAEPGKTYRYKVRYTLFNPAFGMANQPPQIANQFGIDSPDSPWSEPITVPSRTKFWCAKNSSAVSSGDLAFDVYSWHDGLWQQKQFTAQPGDEIGATDPIAGDFLTHWTVLDSRGHAGTSAQLVLLVPDYGGDALVRNVITDESSQDYKHFMVIFRAQPQPQAPAAATPATGGQPPAGNSNPFNGPPGLPPGAPGGGQ